MDTDGMQFENPIDNLTYLYDDTNKNQLLRVFDSTANPQGFSDDSDGISDTEDDYAYDDNGNMTHDDNKGITHITYNHLNLPVEIIFGTYGKIAYLYNATGQKLKKTVTEGTTITTTDYLSGFQYKNLVLQFFPHAEGYVNATEEMVVMGGTSYRFNYVFNYTDHLGNIRLSYSLDPSTKVLKIIEENHYYPFGLKHSGYNSDKMMYTKEAEVLKIKPVPPLFITSYKYRFTNKEWQDELGLNEYAFGWRDYDPAIGRWNVIDQLSEKYISTSPYAFVQNNPVVNREIDGRYFDEKNEKKAARLERRAEKRADKLERRADRLAARGQSTGDLRDRASELRGSAQDIRDMRSDSSTEYRYANVGSKEAKSLGIVGPSTLGTGQNNKGDNVVSMFTEKNVGNQLHETRHGGQNARGEINAVTQSSSIAAEVSAYRAQYSWSGSLLAPTMDSSTISNIVNFQTNPLNRTLMDNNLMPTGVTTTNINNINQINSSFVGNIVEIGQGGGRQPLPTVQNYLMWIYAPLPLK